jgi:hypothetical protein
MISLKPRSADQKLLAYSRNRSSPLPNALATDEADLLWA